MEKPETSCTRYRTCNMYLQTSTDCSSLTTSPPLLRAASINHFTTFSFVLLHTRDARARTSRCSKQSLVSLSPSLTHHCTLNCTSKSVSIRSAASGSYDVPVLTLTAFAVANNGTILRTQGKGREHKQLAHVLRNADAGKWP